MTDPDRIALAEYLKKEDEAFAFSESVEQERVYLLSIDGDCYPWTIDHIVEACEQHDGDEFENSNEMVKWVYEYWDRIATGMADTNVHGRQ